jgi:hypothetical protein
VRIQGGQGDGKRMTVDLGRRQTRFFGILIKSPFYFVTLLISFHYSKFIGEFFKHRNCAAICVVRFSFYYFCFAQAGITEIAETTGKERQEAGTTESRNKWKAGWESRNDGMLERLFHPASISYANLNFPRQ